MVQAGEYCNRRSFSRNLRKGEGRKRKMDHRSDRKGIATERKCKRPKIKKPASEEI